METRRFGRTEMRVSVLGFGAAKIGLQNVDQDMATCLLNTALDAGINVIDTAECYKNSEAMIGNALAHRRQEFYIFTKCGHAFDPGETNWRPQTIVSGVERSLKLLKSEYVDVLQLHSCPFELLRQGDVIDVLDKIKRSGKTRFIGCSADGNAAAYAVGTGKFDVLQTSFSIADQEALDVTFPLARQHDIGVIVKRPLANAVWQHAEKPEDTWLHAYWERLQKLDYPFLWEPGDGALAVSMRFALSPPGVGSAIVGTTNPQHLLSNVRHLDQGRLVPDDFNRIRQRWQECGGADWPGVG